eukprot:521200-Rhodomonas_salina.1
MTTSMPLGVGPNQDRPDLIRTRTDRGTASPSNTRTAPKFESCAWPNVDCNHHDHDASEELLLLPLDVDPARSKPDLPALAPPLKLRQPAGSAAHGLCPGPQPEQLKAERSMLVERSKPLAGVTCFIARRFAIPSNVNLTAPPQNNNR